MGVVGGTGAWVAAGVAGGGGGGVRALGFGFPDSVEPHTPPWMSFNFPFVPI